jgi:DNA-binding MarR family transcriptional regulator
MISGVGEERTRHTGGPGVAFLLAQVGAQAAAEFARRVGTTGMAPSDAGLLRQIATSPGISQQELARRLGVGPSRVVALVDVLEKAGWVSRAPAEGDRRAHALRLTPAGQAKWEELQRVAREHESSFVAALEPPDRERLRELCQRLAEAHGLRPGVHPGYRREARDG